MITRADSKLGHPRKSRVPVPAATLGLAARSLERLPAFPIAADQRRMLLVGNTCEAGGGDAVRGLRRFDEPNLSHLASAA